MTSQKNNDEAQGKFLEHVEAIEQMLERLTRHFESGDAFTVEPEDVNWGHVGSMAETERQLRQIADRLFNEGEYAAEVAAR